MENVSDQYVAGFFDGEGSVSISKTLSPRASIAQNRPEVLGMIKEKFGGEVCIKEGKASHLNITSVNELKFFLESIYPYLVVKKDEVKLILDFLPMIKTKNMGFNPMSQEELTKRDSFRNKLQEIRPNVRFVPGPSLSEIKRKEIRQQQNNKCFDCNIDLTDNIFGALINKDQKLRCRKCSAKSFGPNKIEVKPVTAVQIKKAIESTNNLNEAAKLLGLCRHTLWTKRKKLNLITPSS